jgi:predicted dehydrogenase
VSNLRFAVVGLGNMGGAHINGFPKMPGVTLSAICDIDPARLESAQKKLAEQDLRPQAFTSSDEMLNAKVADAVLIATPHYDHPPIGIAALKTGHHVLVEKPIAVGVKAARELIDEAARHPELVFGIMYNQRSNPMYQKLRELIAEGDLGEVTRVTWLITDWFRTHTYYASGGWRATWAGEGGGVIINQCPHNLDLIQWITGLMPNRVTAVGYIGKTHPIEVEDEMSAILEYSNGAIGHFVTSTGEFPGTNRLEICGDQGKIVAENGKLKFTRTRQRVSDVNKNSPHAFTGIETWDIDVPYPKAPPIGEHERIVRNFIDAVTKKTPLLAPGNEGARGLEIGNAMLMSAMEKRSVTLPLDGDAFDALIKRLTKEYGGKKTLATRQVEVDMNASSMSFR